MAHVVVFVCVSVCMPVCLIACVCVSVPGCLRWSVARGTHARLGHAIRPSRGDGMARLLHSRPPCSPVLGSIMLHVASRPLQRMQEWSPPPPPPPLLLLPPPHAPLFLLFLPHLLLHEAFQGLGTRAHGPPLFIALPRLSIRQEGVQGIVGRSSVRCKGCLSIACRALFPPKPPRAVRAACIASKVASWMGWSRRLEHQA